MIASILGLTACGYSARALAGCREAGCCRADASIAALPFGGPRSGVVASWAWGNQYMLARL